MESKVARVKSQDIGLVARVESQDIGRVARVKSHDAGLTVLQTRGKGVYNLPQRDHHHRIWMKGVAPKGLGEIEEIEHEEVSNKMMQALERFMRSYPAVWSESSVQHLLVEIADTRYASSQNTEAEERLRTIINRILVPMAKLMEDEQGFMMVERQRIQEATLALQRVQEECHLALGDIKLEHDLSSRDLKELTKALEESRTASDDANKKLASKEKQIHDMLQKQRNLMIRLVCGGPAEFLAWARQEIQSCGLIDLNEELELAWGRQIIPDYTLVPDQGSNNSLARESPEMPWIDHKDGDKPCFRHWANVAVKLLCVVGLEVLGQVGESYGRVRGPLSIPSVVAGFWIGIARRMAFLAVATLCPPLVMENTKLAPGGTTSGIAPKITAKSAEEKEVYLRNNENGWMGMLSGLPGCKSDGSLMAMSTMTIASDSERMQA